jgi:preprotein translocase subunit SecY
MVIYYSLAYRRIPINYVRSGNGTIRKNSYLPIKLNPAGVIPVIFAAPIILILGLGVEWIFTNVEFFYSNGVGNFETIIRSMFTFRQDYWYVYSLTYGSIILFFSVFYSYIQMNPQNMSENLQKQAAYIIGVRPGADTEEYLGKVILRVSLLGGLILTIIAILPIILSSGGVLLGTSIIIVVSVIIQIYQGLKSKVESKKYRRLLGV